MRTLNVRELRDAVPRLRQLLAEAGEIVLVSRGVPIARLTPADEPAERRRLPSLKAFRDTLPMGDTPFEVSIREERDRR